MEKFTTLTAVAAALPMANVDTDTIIRVERCVRVPKSEIGRYAFETLRLRPDGGENPDFPLNREPWRAAKILVCGENFGCGSSREMAVWALAGMGVRCVIAPSFGEIFFGNCLQNGVLAVRLPNAEVARLAERASKPDSSTFTIDLQRQKINGEIPFEIEPLKKRMLLEGLDAIGLTLSREPNAAKAHLQGWAVLENMSGEDWKSVELTLLSGNPVSFRQAIYQAYYVDRPEVPVEVAGRILPQTDTGNVNRDQLAAGKARPGSAPAPAPPPTQAQQRGTGFNYEANNGPVTSDAQTPAPTVDTAEAQESMTQVLFRLPAPLTLASGQSALVPIVDRDVPARRIDLLQSATNALHPLASVKITNDVGNGLPPGVVTLYEQTGAGSAYLGDARVGVLPAGENRLLSYAIDDKTKSVREPTTKSSLSKASISQGVLYLTYTERQTIVFRLNAPPSEERHVLVEQPMLAGWKLIEPGEKSVETTANAYRVAVDLKPGEAKTVTFVFEAPRIESARISDFDDASLAQVTATREIDPAVKSALTELARLRRVVAEKRQAEEQIKAEIAEITADQTRIRANLQSVDKDSALHKRYIEKLAQEETRLETLQTDRSKAADATRAAQSAVDAYIAKLSI